MIPNTIDYEWEMRDKSVTVCATLADPAERGLPQPGDLERIFLYVGDRGEKQLLLRAGKNVFERAQLSEPTPEGIPLYGPGFRAQFFQELDTRMIEIRCDVFGDNPSDNVRRASNFCGNLASFYGAQERPD